MPDIRTLESELNSMTQAGKMLDALEKFYAEDCTFQEGNQPPRRGRKAQHDHLSAFFKTLKSFNGATLHAACVGENAATAERTFDMTGPSGPILWNEVLARRWRNGRVVSERYYTAP